jgi:hypothetical protein
VRTALLFLTLLLTKSPTEPAWDRPDQHLEPLGTPTLSEGLLFDALWRNSRPAIAMVSFVDSGKKGDDAETSVGIVEEHDDSYQHDQYFVVVSRTKTSIRTQYWEALQAIRKKKHIPDGKRSTPEDDLAALSLVDTGLIESKTPLKKETACDLWLIWRSALAGIRPANTGLVSHHATKYVFTGWSGGGRTSSPSAASPMGALVALGNDLLRYGQASQTQLVESEKQLTLQVQASAKFLGADIAATAAARMWHPPSPCLGTGRE